MVRPSTFFCLLLICSWYQTSNGNPFMVAKLVINKAMLIYDGYQKTKEFFSSESNDLTNQDISNKLKSLSAELAKMQTAIMDKISEDLVSKLVDKAEKFFTAIEDINSSYEYFNKLLKGTKKYAVSTYHTFANASTMPGASGGLYRAHEKLYEVFFHENLIKESLLTLISKNHTAIDLMCKQRESKQQLINDFFAILIEYSTKATLITVYSYDLKEKLENVTYEVERNEVKDIFIDRINMASLKVKNALRQATREIWRCTPKTHELGRTYDKLQQVFQAFIVYNMNTWNKDRGVPSLLTLDFSGLECSDIKDDRLINPDLDKAVYNTRYYEETLARARCWGHLRDCKEVNGFFDVCYSFPQSDRRYEWVKNNPDSTDTLYGTYTNVCYLTQGWDFQNSGGHHACICNCESEDRDHDRYFSLLDVLSDDDKVVTGTKLTKKDHVFHIQIQQGILGPNGTIIGNATWKDVHTITRDQLLANNVSVQNPRSVDYFKNDLVYAVTYSQNTVYLDKLEHEDLERLVTGLRFQQVGDDLRLEIRTTPFNYDTGKLDTKDHSWTVHLETKRTRNSFIMTEPGDPTIYRGSDIITSNNKYVKFRMSSLDKDVGSYTVPYIDIQEIVTKPSMPLTGVGLIHKGPEGSGGFLGFEILHYDYTDHL